MINDEWKRMVGQARQAEEMLRGLPKGIDFLGLDKVREAEERLLGLTKGLDLSAYGKAREVEEMIRLSKGIDVSALGKESQVEEMMRFTKGTELSALSKANQIDEMMRGLTNGIDISALYKAQEVAQTEHQRIEEGYKTYLRSIALPRNELAGAIDAIRESSIAAVLGAANLNGGAIDALTGNAVAAAVRAAGLNTGAIDAIRGSSVSAVLRAANLETGAIDAMRNNSVAALLGATRLGTSAYFDAIEQAKSTIERVLPLSQFRQIAGEFDVARKMLAGTEWAALVEQLREQVGDENESQPVSVFDEIYAFARTTFQSTKNADKPSAREVREWIANLICIYALVLALVADHDLKEIKAEQQVHHVLLMEVKQELRRLDAMRIRKFAVLERPAVVYAKPESGAARIGMLKPRESVIQIGHHSKWIRVEYYDEGRLMVGWVLKKYLEHLPAEPEFDE